MQISPQHFFIWLTFFEGERMWSWLIYIFIFFKKNYTHKSVSSFLCPNINLINFVQSKKVQAWAWKKVEINKGESFLWNDPIYWMARGGNNLQNFTDAISIVWVISDVFRVFIVLPYILDARNKFRFFIFLIRKNVHANTFSLILYYNFCSLFFSVSVILFVYD